MQDQMITHARSGDNSGEFSMQKINMELLISLVTWCLFLAFKGRFQSSHCLLHILASSWTPWFDANARDDCS